MLVHRELWLGLLNTAEHYFVPVALVSSYWPDRPSSVVLVGGSYDSRVHSAWEPAAYAKPILTGPHIRNSAEALALEHCGLLRVCPGGPGAR